MGAWNILGYSNKLHMLVNDLTKNDIYVSQSVFIEISVKWVSELVYVFGTTILFFISRGPTVYAAPCISIAISPYPSSHHLQ